MTSAPEYHSHEEFQNRSAKLAQIRKAGVDPYPAMFTPGANSKALHDQHADHPVGHSEDAAAGSTPETVIAGRLVLFRAMGKNAFATVQDESGRIQVMFNRDMTQVTGYQPAPSDLSHSKFIEKLLDLGDFIGIEGNLFRTLKGELTVFAKQVTVLCKTLLPLPDKHSGLTHKELRYRKRWLDLISHEEVRDTFRKRSQIVQILRQVCMDHGFMEVETPILQSIYGGANAQPFETHLNALKQDMFLRISLEIPLKKLIIGGMERVFEIGKVFRNEGIDRSHNPEFTELEAYAAYWDYEELMRFTETLFESLAFGLHGSTQVRYTGFLEKNAEIAIDYTRPWQRLTIKQAIAKYAEVDVDKHDDRGLREILHARTDMDPEKIGAATRGLLVNHLFEELVEHHLIQPCHITDFPIETTPLCKLHRDPEKRAERIVERVESYVLGNEICNGYSELNDPELQRELLQGQQRRRDLGDEEAPPMDEEFVEAICQGMPPTGGIGFGVDRLVMLFTSAHSIRDVLYFPLMRAEHVAEEG